MPQLRVRNLSKQYGQRLVVEDISLTESVTFVMKNGEIYKND